jgi:hypothetical protein
MPQPDWRDAIRANVAANPRPYRQISPPGSVVYGNPSNRYGPQPTAPAPTGPATPGAGGGGPGSGPIQVQTTITPTSLYSPTQTQHAVNQAFADNVPDANAAMKPFDRPGVSRSAGTQAAALPGMAQDMSQAMEARASIPMQDAIANQQHLMAGEVAREQQGLDLATLLQRQNQIGQRGQMGQMQQNMSLLDALLSGAF